MGTPIGKSANVPGDTAGWDFETAGRKGTLPMATMGQVEKAVRDPSFQTALNSNPALRSAAAAMADGTTESEANNFQTALNAPPGAKASFEAALESIVKIDYIVHELQTKGSITFQSN